MHQCPRCHRANPIEALYCYFDGAELRRRPGREDGTRDVQLPHPFVFPSGRSCRSYDDLVQACQAEWEVARDLLSQGVFHQFLATAGRLDLAQAAQQAKSKLDPDIALENFLASLPAQVERGARLDLNLRRLNLGTLRVGDTRQIRLAIVNQGNGLLHGTLTVADGTGWLRLGEGKGNGQCLIKTTQQQEVTIRVDTHGLAAPHPYSAKLTVITNGGVVEVPVGLDLEIQPFALPPFEGIGSPREMAERMRTHPKAAVPFLESGEIARWFEVNGWTYPVSEPTARGVAAVQQFFEGMGLSKPPAVQPSMTDFSQSCQPGEVIQGQLALRTAARKWIYARAESDAPWLRLAEQNVSGPQQAVVTFEAHSQHLQPGRLHEANLTITANAGQVLRVPVRLDVRRAVSHRTEQPPRPILVGAVAGFMFRLLLVPPADLWVQLGLGSPDLLIPAVRQFVLMTWWIGALLGASLLWKRGHRGTDLVYGLIAGAVAGLVGSATLACLLPGMDWLPSLFRVKAAGLGWFWTPSRIALALVSWVIWGVLVGFSLSWIGRPGTRVLTRLATALGSLCRLCGLKRAAAYFAVA